MRVIQVFLSAGVILSAGADGMSCSESGTKPSRKNGNLLPNSSFEKHGEPTLEGWPRPNSFNKDCWRNVNHHQLGDHT
jgi:hypothetical protein